ncbi:MAG: nuclear transport factor 2 family protein [Solirubrobacterales bacterium]
MSQENVEVVRQMLEAYHRGDAEASLAHFDPEVTVDVSRRGEGGVGRGREELRRITVEWVREWDNWHEEVEEIRDLGSQVYVIAIQRGRGKRSGIEVENRYALLYEFKGDKISRMTGYRNPEEALQAAGLSE